MIRASQIRHHYYFTLGETAPQGEERLGKNRSFFVVRGDIAVKLSWGDFNANDLLDRSFEPHWPMVNTFRAMGLTVEQSKDEFPVDIVTVSPDEPVYVLGEYESYFRVPSEAIVQRAPGPANDPESKSAWRDTMPSDAVVLRAEYILKEAVGIIRNGVYTRTEDAYRQTRAQEVS
jgi:hypothetical protein